MPKIPEGVRGAVITGWGSALPPKVLTNKDLEGMFETNDDWIVERTGIRERHVGGTTAGLSIESGRKALDMAGIDPSEIDALILATTTPDRTVPATSASVQHELGLRCGASDINAACSGFMYGLVNAHGLIAMGARKVLVIGTDTLARITDWTDRNTAILFADGSGAVCSSMSRAPDNCSAGISMPTVAPSDFCTQRSAASFRWKAKKSSVAPCALWSTRPPSRCSTLASPPTTSSWSCPIKPTCALSKPHAIASASLSNALPQCCITQATHRPRRFHWRWLMHSTMAGSSKAISCCSLASALA